MPTLTERTDRHDWLRRSIESLCTRITTGGTPYRKNPEFYRGGTIRWVKTKELKDWYVDDTEEKITEEALTSSSAKLLPPETVLMAMYGDGRTITSLGILRSHSACNQASCAMIADSSLCSHLFLFYSLKYHREDFIHLASGGAQRNLNGKTIREFRIAVPDRKIQDRIVSVLSAYDTLIENNTRRIKVLEEMAKMTFREWFVNFRFPGHKAVTMVESELGMIPRGWEVKKLFDVAEVTYGYPFKSKLFTEEPIGIAVIRIRDIRSGKSATFTSESVDDKYIVKNGDLLVGMDGDFHMGKWSGGKAYLNQRVVRFRPKADLPSYFLFLALQAPVGHFNSTIVGTTVAHLSDRDLRSISIAVPDEATMEHAKSLFDPCFDLEVSLAMKNLNLRQTRDLLLPKLISGEVSVEQCETEFVVQSA